MAELNIYFVSINDDCCLPRLLALWELANSQLLRNLGRHYGVTELGLSWEHKIILFFRVWPRAKSPGRSLFCFPPSTQRTTGELPLYWRKDEVESFGQEFYLVPLLSFLEGTALLVVGYMCGAAVSSYFLFLRQNYL